MARNKSAIIVAGSRFNCYPRIDFTINIFGHRVSLYYYSTITITTTSTSASFHRSLFFIGSFEKCFIVRKREVVPLVSYYPLFLRLPTRRENYLIARLERKYGFNSVNSCKVIIPPSFF